MLLREFTCPVCGAPRRTTDGAVAVVCSHCGALLTYAGGGRWEPGTAERHASAIRDLVKPDAARARLFAVTAEVQACLAPELRELWRLLTEEQVVLMTVVHVGVVAPLPSSPAARAKHVADAVVMSEITTFDPTVGSALRAYGAAAGALTTRGPEPRVDPVAAARSMLAAARAYQSALASHPSLPAGVLREGPEHHAREMVRQAVLGYAPLLAAGVVDRIRVDVLGDVAGGTAACPKCGAPLDEPGLARCRHCGAVTSIDLEDGWTVAQLGLWEIARAELLRRGELEGPGPAIAAIGCFIHSGARGVPPAKAAAFLRRAVPWVTREDLHRAIELLGSALDADQRALLEALAAETRDWQPDDGARPTPAPKRTDFPAPTVAEEAAWIEMALASYRLRGGPALPLVELLAHPLSAMQIAAVHEAPAGVSARAALAFFEQAVPGFDRRAMRVEVDRLTPGYDHPRVRAFLLGLAEVLG